MQKFIRFTLLFLLLFSANSNVSLAQYWASLHTMEQEKGNTSIPKGDLEDLEWLIGDWVGNGPWGEVSCTWKKPQNGQMLGIGQINIDSETSIIELLAIVEDEGSMELRIKHFNEDFKAWESKDAYSKFRLLDIRNNEIYFEGYTFTKRDDETIESYILLNDGSKSEELAYTFHLNK